jgi:hypothetical protein
MHALLVVNNDVLMINNLLDDSIECYPQSAEGKIGLYRCLNRLNILQIWNNMFYLYFTSVVRIEWK